MDGCDLSCSFESFWSALICAALRTSSIRTSSGIVHIDVCYAFLARGCKGPVLSPRLYYTKSNWIPALSNAWCYSDAIRSSLAGYARWGADLLTVVTSGLPTSEALVRFFMQTRPFVCRGNQTTRISFVHSSNKFELTCWSTHESGIDNENNTTTGKILLRQISNLVELN